MSGVEGEKLTEEQNWSGPMGQRWLANLDRFESMIAPVGEALLGAAAFQPGERVVEIGCGGGANSLQIAAQVAPGGTVLGLDISEPLIGASRSRAAAAGVRNARFMAGDAATAALPEASFDRLFSRFGVMFFSDPHAAFAHMHGFLRPGGRLDFACWGPPDENPAFSDIGKVMRRYVDSPPPAPRTPGPLAFGEQDYVRDILTHGGFRDIAITPWRGEVYMGGAGATPEAAVAFSTESSTSAAAFADLPPDIQAAARKDLLELFTRRHGPRGVAFEAMVWLVGAAA